MRYLAKKYDFKYQDMMYHEKCAGCKKMYPHESRDRLLEEGATICPYSYPSRQWTRLEGCAARTHNRVSQIEDVRKPVNPLKASRRSMKKV